MDSGTRSRRRGGLMTRSAFGAAAILAVFFLTSPDSRKLHAQSSTGQGAAGPQVIGARSYSPMVENLDATMAFYARLGLKVPPPEKGNTYPWDEEAWHYDLHGGQAPKSQMRFTYANVPGAVPPAKPLLIEPVEPPGIARKTRPPLPQNPGSTTLVVVVRDLDLAVSKLPEELQQPVRRASYY